MSRTPKKPPLALDMDFSEALTRFSKVNPKELQKKISNKNNILKKKTK